MKYYFMSGSYIEAQKIFVDCDKNILCEQF